MRLLESLTRNENKSGQAKSSHQGGYMSDIRPGSRPLRAHEGLYNLDDDYDDENDDDDDDDDDQNLKLKGDRKLSYVNIYF